VPVLICSVLNEPEIAFTLGASDYLPKPVTQDDLLAKLERWCRSPSLPRYRDRIACRYFKISVEVKPFGLKIVIGRSGIASSSSRPLMAMTGIFVVFGGIL